MDESPVQSSGVLIFWGISWVSIGHEVVRPPSPPIPDKPTHSQVGPGITWSSECVGICIHTHIVFQLEGAMNLGE